MTGPDWQPPARRKRHVRGTQPSRELAAPAATGTREFGFRDDTQFEIVVGVAVRLDEYVETHPSSLPFAEQERVRVKWRASTTSDSQVATHVSPAKP